MNKSTKNLVFVGDKVRNIEKILMRIYDKGIDVYASYRGRNAPRTASSMFRVYIEKSPTIVRSHDSEIAVSPWFFMGELAVWISGFDMGANVVSKGRDE